MTLPFGVRDATEEDRGYIENAWRATMLAMSPAVQGADPAHYHSEMSRVLSRLMPTLPGNSVRVAHDPKDENNLVGFIAATKHELHYLYVGGDFRKLGVAPLLLDGLKISCYTFSTPPGVRRLKPRERGWKFCPRFTIF